MKFFQRVLTVLNTGEICAQVQFNVDGYVYIRLIDRKGSGASKEKFLHDFPVNPGLKDYDKELVQLVMDDINLLLAERSDSAVM